MFVGKARSVPKSGQLQALPANIILVWKGLPGTKTLASSLIQTFVNYGRKKFINIEARFHNY
jgi:hypothetical protein